jgi:hypothetical protein
MHVCYTACCGLDVHKKRVVAYLRTPGANGQRRSEVRTFATTTRALMELADWLVASACTHVAIAYASYCTSLDRCERFSVMRSLFDNLTPLAFCGGFGPGSS